MALTTHQKRVLHHILSVGVKEHATKKDLLSAIETAAVETNFGNPAGGDGTSSGWRQQISGAGVKSQDRRNIRKQASYFFQELKGAGGGSAGNRAQQVQRSAYPDRYDQHEAQAKQILDAFLKGKLGGGQAAGGGSKTTTTRTPGALEETQTLDAAGLQNARGLQMLSQKISNEQSGGLLESLTGGQKKVKSPLGDDPGYSGLFKSGVLSTAAPDPANFVKTDLKRGADVVTKTTTKDGAPAKGSDPKKAVGVADFEGTKVAAWIKPYLVYARKHGWKGNVSSGWRSLAKQTEIYNSGVRPAAKPGTSNHEGSEWPRGAVDVSNAVQLDAILRKYPGRKLIYAGAKDPVHFSYPHGGHY